MPTTHTHTNTTHTHTHAHTQTHTNTHTYTTVMPQTKKEKCMYANLLCGDANIDTYTVADRYVSIRQGKHTHTHTHTHTHIHTQRERHTHIQYAYSCHLTEERCTCQRVEVSTH